MSPLNQRGPALTAPVRGAGQTAVQLDLTLYDTVSRRGTNRISNAVKLVSVHKVGYFVDTNY
jgi:hypothetical protein